MCGDDAKDHRVTIHSTHCKSNNSPPIEEHSAPGSKGILTMRTDKFVIFAKP